MADNQETLLLKIKEQGDLVRKLKAAKESGEKVSFIFNLLCHESSILLNRYSIASHCKLK